jgi:hypothetical protein
MSLLTSYLRIYADLQIKNIVDAVASLNPKKLPSMQYYINPLDGILANQITVFASRMGAIIVTNEVYVYSTLSPSILC